MLGGLFGIRSIVRNYSALYSNRSPGWQSRALQIASRVESLTARALPVLRIERLTTEISTLSDSSDSDILRLASITSRFMIIAMSSKVYTVIVSSSFRLIAIL